MGLPKIFYYPRPLWRIYSVIACILTALFMLSWGSLMFVFLVVGTTDDRITWFIRSWCAMVSSLYGIEYRISGQENHDPKSASLIVSNHQSVFDIPAAYVALSGNIRMVAKKELFSIPIFGPCVRRAGFVPIERGNQASGKVASEKIRAIVRSGLHVWVAPEGTRSEGHHLLPFKKGSFAVAIDAQIPVQPILIENSYEACPKGSFLVRPGTKIRVRVLPRISAEGWKISQRAELAEKVRTEMLSAFEGEDPATSHLLT